MREVESLTSVLLVSSCPHSLLGLILCPLDLDNPQDPREGEAAQAVLVTDPDRPTAHLKTGARPETLSLQVEISEICPESYCLPAGCS